MIQRSVLQPATPSHVYLLTFLKPAARSFLYSSSPLSPLAAQIPITPRYFKYLRYESWASRINTSGGVYVRLNAFIPPPRCVTSVEGDFLLVQWVIANSKSCEVTSWAQTHTQTGVNFVERGKRENTNWKSPAVVWIKAFLFSALPKWGQIEA